MNIGMLWLGDKPEEAINYYVRKYKVNPDKIELPQVTYDKLKGDGKLHSYEGIKVVASQYVILGNMIVGVDKDTRLSYNLE